MCLDYMYKYEIARIYYVILRDRVKKCILFQVLPGLYVGNYRDSKDPVQLDKYKITHILSIHDAARRLHAVSLAFFYSL